MHKEWVRLTTKEEGEWWKYNPDTNEYPNRTERYRYVEEGEPNSGSTGDQYVEVYRDVRDENDEPEEDGVYQDVDGDRWIHIEGLWADGLVGTYAYWDRIAYKYAPFTRVPVDEL